MSNNLKAQIGERIGLLREKHGYSPDFFAELIGVSRPTVVNWESGKRSPEHEKLILIALELNTTTDYLIGLTTNPLQPEAVKSFESLLENTTLTYKKKELNEKHKKAMLQLLDIVVEYDK